MSDNNEALPDSETLADRTERIRVDHNISFSEALRVACSEVHFETMKERRANAK